MILRRYGDSLHSVELNFDSKALTEIGFRRDQGLSMPREGFEQRYQRMDAHELAAEMEGWVQDEVERGALDQLAARVRELEAELPEGGVLVIESEQGVDHPKTRTDQKTVVEQGENRFFFKVRVEPPLRVARYRKGS
jgi:hypothetical protein